jgi:hypothetical protein
MAAKAARAMRQAERMRSLVDGFMIVILSNALPF